jgi:DHA2 family multidrug resistance protein
MGVVLSFVLGFGLFGSTFIIPLYTQSMLGWTAQKSGMLQLPSTIFVAFMMPIVGMLIQKGVPQKYMISVGMGVFFLYSYFSYKILTPWTGSEHFFWILILRGFGMGLLSIPISTMALSTLRGKEIGQGAAFTGMMRQLGGSFGIAVISTLMTYRVSVHASTLSAYITADNPVVQQRLQQAGPNGQQRVYASFMGSIMKQATLLSYMDVFLYVGIMFLVFVPLVLLFVKRGKNKVSLADAAH